MKGAEGEEEESEEESEDEEGEGFDTCLVQSVSVIMSTGSNITQMWYTSYKHLHCQQFLKFFCVVISR